VKIGVILYNYLSLSETSMCQTPNMSSICTVGAT